MNTYAQSPYSPSYSQQQPAPFMGYPQQDYAQPAFPMGLPGTGQMIVQQPSGAMIGVDPNAQPSMLDKAKTYGQKTALGIPYWAWGTGALLFTGIGLAWNAGVFGGKTMSRTTTRRTTTRRASARDPERMKSRTVTRSFSSGGGHGMARPNPFAAAAMESRDPARGKKRSKKKSKRTTTVTRKRRAGKRGKR